MCGGVLSKGMFGCAIMRAAQTARHLVILLIPLVFRELKRVVVTCLGACILITKATRTW